LSKNRVKIIIDDKPFTLVGEETEEHIKQVADYINVKIQEVKGLSPHIAADVRMTHVLTSINVADDFFKEREKNAILTKQLADTERKRALEETRNKQMKELKKLLEAARNAIVENQNKLKQKEDLLLEEKQKYQNISDELKKNKLDLETLKKEKQQAEEKCKQIEDTLEQKKVQFDKLETEQKQLSEIKERLKQCEQALENTRQQWNDSKEKLKEIEEQKDTYQKQLELANNKLNEQSNVTVWEEKERQYEQELDSLILLLESEKKQTQHLQQQIQETSQLEQREFERQTIWEKKEKI